MASPRMDNPYALQSKTEQTINQQIDNDTELNESDLLSVYIVAQVESGIEQYRNRTEE